MRLKVKMNDVNTGKIDALDPSMPPVDVFVSGVTKQYSYVFVGVCEDRYIKKKITLFTAVPCPSWSTFTTPISRVTGGIIVAVTGLTAARPIGARFACYSKTNIINKLCVVLFFF